MRGDETQPALAKEGPRHAAPRKSLLNRIQGPAGKAMALAAMPTAVLVGMGLTPRLALADDADIPFAPGPCVTRSDEPTPEATGTAKPDESAKPTATPTDTPSATATPSSTATPTATATPTPAATQTGQTAAPQTQEHATTAPAPAATPTATPSPTQSKNPLDPLGLGDALKDLLDGPDKTPTATPTTAAPTTPAPQQTGAPADKAPATDAPSTTAPTTAAKPTTDPATEKTKAAIAKAAEVAGAKVEELPESAQGLDAKPDTDIPDGAKPRFPCPEPDPEALAAAEMEPGIPLLPDEPWRLDSTRLELIGLKYHGIVEVKTGSGKIKKVLKFTASNVNIKDLHQTTVHSEGLSGHVRSTPGKTSTITDGTVTMYTESLKGNLFGLIPVTFSPETPPPLDVPWAVFTKVTVIQAGQFGGTLMVPGLRNTIEPS
ncbi:hypothetical protein [Streptomyces sp. TLI_105]|uniref:hypothetical protein n=1 Tax=Streptomyces sp. TLI_105 TaxID=1881019 RepID=UPI000895E882|nr:hypothetical protein SAMN05428939_2442 [Streptomyces sp. TLI_105]